MNARHIEKLIVFHNGSTVGRLHTGPDRGEITFQYDTNWLSAGFDLAPNSLAFSSSPQTAPNALFHGLQGVFAASLPNGWGLLLMDREFKRQRNWNQNEITPLDRLAYMGSRAMGALEYRPEIDLNINDHIDLSTILSSVDDVLPGEQTNVLQQLQIQGGSPGGARPKVIVARAKNSNEILSGFHTLPAEYEHWILNFVQKMIPLIWDVSRWLMPTWRKRPI